MLLGAEIMPTARLANAEAERRIGVGLLSKTGRTQEQARKNCDASDQVPHVSPKWCQ